MHSSLAQVIHAGRKTYLSASIRSWYFLAVCSAISNTFWRSLSMSPGSGSRVLVLKAIRPLTYSGTRDARNRQPQTANDGGTSSHRGKPSLTLS